MGIKLLDAYLTEKKLVHSLPLSVLADTRLGIDASHYLAHILETPATREPLLAATGGLPLALSTRIESDLRVLEKQRIKPVFVFPGLLPTKRPRPHLQGEYYEACRDRKDAWSKYEAGQEEQAQKLFESRPCIIQWDLWRSVLRIFRHRNVEFLVAPYTPAAQLIYLQRHGKSYIHAIYGPTEALMYFGVDKIITSVDFANLDFTSVDFASSSPTFQYISKKAILSDLGQTEDQFLDTGLLMGCEHLPTFPATYDHPVRSFVDMIKYYKTGHAAVATFIDHPMVKQMNYLDAFCRARCMLKFSLIISSEGSVVPLPLALHPQAEHRNNHAITAAEIPQDLHEVFTHRLPDEIYFYLSRGLVGPQILVWLTSGQVIEPPPLDSGEANEYRRFVKEIITEGATGPRATALALISSVIHNFWSNRRVASSFWWEAGPVSAQKHIMHASHHTTQLAERVAGWNCSSVLVEDELRKQNSSTIDFALCLGATSSEKSAARTRTKPASSSRSLEKKDEVVANVIWRFLELRGFLLSNHTHSSFARAMYSAIKATRVNDKFQDPLYLFLELVRAGVLHNSLWSGRAYSGGPSFGTDEEKKCMLLVMRVLSILPLNFKPEPWSAPLSRELLVFNSFVRSLSRALRTLIEVTALNMLLRSDARRQRDDLLDISLSLPFQTDVNTGFGVLAKVYLDALTHLNGGHRVVDANADGIADAKAMALDICEETFTGVKLPKTEVERGFRFWDSALTAIRSLHADGNVIPELADSFERAEAWLRPMRP